MPSETTDGTCPYCGERIDSLWEITKDTFKIDCPFCDKPIEGDRQIDVTYTLTRDKDEDGG